MTTRYYLAYGSNLHPLRLTQRVPSARLIDIVELTGHKVLFHKRGHDRSGKCNLMRTNRAEDTAYGAVYLVSEKEKPDLDRIEGVGTGYSVTDIEVRVRGESRTCFTYLAQDGHTDDAIMPYHWYKSLVHLGAVHLGFPAFYQEFLAAVPSMEDPDIQRKLLHETLIAQIKESLRPRAPVSGPNGPQEFSG